MDAIMTKNLMEIIFPVVLITILFIVFIIFTYMIIFIDRGTKCKN